MEECGAGKMGAPGETLRSGFVGERRNTEMSEFFRIRKNEGYGGCDDAPAVWLASAISVAVGICAAKVMGKFWR